MEVNTLRIYRTSNQKHDRPSSPVRPTDLVIREDVSNKRTLEVERSSSAAREKGDSS